MRKEYRWVFRLLRGVLLAAGLLLVLAAMSVFGGSSPLVAAPGDACLPEVIGQIANVTDPKGIAVNEARGKFYVASFSTNSLLVVDAATRRVEHTATGIPSPNQVAYNPTLNRIYITNRNTHTLTVLDGDDYHALFPAIPIGRSPYGVGVDSGDGRVYVANFDAYTVSVLDGMTGEVIATAPVPRRPTFVAVDAKRHVAYVASLDTGNVSIVTAQGEVSSFAHLEDAATVGIALDPGLDRLFITSYTGKVYVYDVPTRTRVAAISVGSRMLWSTTMNPADHQLFAAVNGPPSWLEQIDGQTSAYAGHAVVGWGDGEGLAVNSHSGQMLVSNFNDDSLTLLRDTCAPAPPVTTERWFGSVKITAQKFEPVPGKPGFFKATGGIRLGDHYTLADPASEQAWVEFSETAQEMLASGQLSAFDGATTLGLLRGGFSVMRDGIAHPAQTATTLLNQIAGFAMAGSGILPEFNLTPTGFRVQGSGAIDLAGAKGTAVFTISLVAGKFHVEGSVQLANSLKLGDGSILSISGLTGSLGTEGARVAGTLHIRLPEGNVADAPVELMIKRDGTFSATAKVMGTWSFNLAGSTLRITNFLLDQSGVSVDSAVLYLPPSLGSATLVVQALKITPAGITHGGIVGQLSQPLTLGADGFKVTVNTIMLVIPPNWAPFQLTIDGEVDIAGDGFSTKAHATITLQGQHLSAAIHDFDLNISGLTVSARQVSLDGSGLRAKVVTLGMPAGFGGATVTLVGLEVSRDGIQIAGGSFAIPDIDAGGFRLTNLHGGFVPVGDGYQISAGGRFVTGDLASTTGCKGIAVDVTMRITKTGAVAVEVAPPGGHAKLASVASAPIKTTAPDGFWLDHAALSFECRIPIGTTGFYLAGVSGEFSLDQAADNVRVQLSLRVESELVPGLSVAPLAATGSATLNTKPFSLLLEATVAVFGQEMSQTTVLITPNSFSATINVQIAVLRGEIAIQAWSADSKFHFTGTGKAEIFMGRGSIFTWRVPILNIPIVIPPGDTYIGGVDVAAGEFNNGRWGFRGRACLQGYCAGVYIDTSGKLTVGNVDSYVLVTPRQFAAARAIWQAQQMGGAVMMAPEPGPEIWVIDANVISTPVTVTTGADVIFVLNRSAALPTLTLRTPPPAATPITPTSLPANVQYAVDTVPGAAPGDPTRTQEMYVVHAAQGGVWQAVLTGEPGPATNYAFAAIGAAPPPALGGVVALDTGAISANLTWQLTAQAPITVSVYAQPGAAEPVGAQAVYSGYLVYTNAAPRTDGQPQSAAIDLSRLTSGVYHLWAEADDGRNAPVRAYAVQAITVTQAWNNVWSAHLRATPGYRSLDVAWDRSIQPDVDRYVLHVRSTPAMPDTPMNVGQSLALAVGGLNPGQNYQLWVEAFNDDAVPPATARSEEISVLLPTFAFDLEAGDSSLVLIPGETGKIPILLRANLPTYPDLAALFPGDLPIGFGLTFTPNVITPTLAGATVQAEITVDAHLPGGNYLLPITARGGGASRTLNLPVTLLQPSLTLLAAPQALTLSGNGAGAAQIHAVGVFGAQDPVSLSVQNTPAGLQTRFEHTTLRPGEQTTLLLVDTPALPPGAYTIEVVAAMGSITRTAAVQINVLDRTDIFFPRVHRQSTTCPQAVANGGFEQNTAWVFPATASMGSYVNDAALSGSRSARLGLLPGAAAARAGAEINLLGELAPTAGTYSDMYQSIRIPASAAHARLSFWYRPFSQDRSHDVQRVLLLEPSTYRVLAVVLQTAEEGGIWRRAGYDLGSLAGQEILLYFEVFNDSTAASGRTWMYVDDVSVSACN